MEKERGVLNTDYYDVFKDSTYDTPPSPPLSLRPFLLRSEFKASIHAEYQKLEKEMSNVEKVLTDRHLTRRELMEQRVSVLQVRRGRRDGGKEALHLYTVL